MRGIFPLAAIVVLAAALTAAAAQDKKQSDGTARTLQVAATPISSFSREEPERVRFGALEFRGGIVLTADDERFGGLSGLSMLGDGKTFLAISDRGHWLRGKLRLEGTRLVGIEGAEIAPMLDATGAPLANGSSYDTESLALGYEGELFVGIERTHRLVRFDFGKHGVSARARSMNVPRTFRDLPRNQGIEGLIFVPHDRPLGGALLAFSERALDRDGNIRGLILGGPSPGEFTVRRSKNFDITDAALIPGGDIVILERYFSWLGGLGMRIRLIRLADIRPGALLDGTVLIEAGNGEQIDNMEGIAAHVTEDGETLITVVSDDNFSGLQRTLLLRFALVARTGQ